MVGFEQWATQNRPDAVIVVGDVNSTAACALVAAKAGIPIAHVEAGLRSFDDSMPEEVNRVVVDRLSTWLLTPSADADENLLGEGVDAHRIHRVGNVMVDSLLANLSTAIALGCEPSHEYALVTLHRPALVDDPQRLRPVIASLCQLSRHLPIVFPVHPRTRQRLEALDLPDLAAIELREPVGYLESICLQANARVVLTDSGGMQEETTVLGVPCLTLRENTERPITITEGTNTLVGLDPERILQAARAALSVPTTRRRPELWDGHASRRIVDVLEAGPPMRSWAARAIAELQWSTR
jgi:UDP-N-acetylglucosamine 2-epimerase (non-hydrolysing)